MVRRGVVILLVVAGLFGASAAAGFLLAKGALRRAPAAGLPGAPDVPRSAVVHPSAMPPETAGTIAPAPASPPSVPRGLPSPMPQVGGASATGAPAASPAPQQHPAPAAPQPNSSPPTAPNVATPASTPRAVSVVPGRLHVQVGGFEDRQNADALALSLRARGYAVTVTDGPPYRVWVGGYLDLATASRLAENLRDIGLSPALVPQ